MTEKEQGERADALASAFSEGDEAAATAALTELVALARVKPWTALTLTAAITERITSLNMMSRLMRSDDVCDHFSETLRAAGVANGELPADASEETTH